MKLRDLLNEAVLQTKSLVKKLLPHLTFDEFKFASMSRETLYFEYDGDDFKSTTKSDKKSNFYVTVIVKSQEKSDTPQLLSAHLGKRRTSDGSESLKIELSAIPSKKGMSHIKDELMNFLVHELTHLKQFALEVKQGPKLTRELHQKRVAKQNKKHQKKRTPKEKFQFLVKDYFADKNELMAYANNFSDEMDLSDYKKLSREIKYDPDITSLREISMKYKGHKWFTPNTKNIFILFSSFKRTDRTFKTLTKYFVSYLQKKENE